MNKKDKKDKKVKKDKPKIDLNININILLGVIIGLVILISIIFAFTRRNKNKIDLDKTTSIVDQDVDRIPEGMLNFKEQADRGEESKEPLSEERESLIKGDLSFKHQGNKSKPSKSYYYKYPDNAIKGLFDIINSGVGYNKIDALSYQRDLSEVLTLEDKEMFLSFLFNYYDIVTDVNSKDGQDLVELTVFGLNKNKLQNVINTASKGKDIIEFKNIFLNEMQNVKVVDKEEVINITLKPIEKFGRYYIDSTDENITKINDFLDLKLPKYDKIKLKQNQNPLDFVNSKIETDETIRYNVNILTNPIFYN